MHLHPTPPHSSPGCASAPPAPGGHPVAPALSCGPAQTLFLDVAAVAQLLQRCGLAAATAGIAERIATDFRRWADFDKSVRSACHASAGVVELMPVADASHYSFKYVNGHPGNPGLPAPLPTVLAFGVLADMASGLPRLLCDLTLATAVRTAATSALAARHLARPGSRVMALVGNGAQAEFQALAFRALLGITTLRPFDTDPAATDKLVANLAGSGLALQRCTSTAEALRGADIVTTLTADKRHASIVTPAMLAPGMHLNAVGGDCPGKTELHPGVLQAAQVFVEYAPQTRIEGELQQMPADFPVTELWQVLTGADPGRRNAQAVTVFDSVGFALEDFSTLGWLHDSALAWGIGRHIGLVARPADPKNLFALLEPHAPPAAPAVQATGSASSLPSEAGAPP